jgi:cell division protein FtsI/penicillin-binding protein 2
VFCRHELAIQALQTGDGDDAAKPLVTDKEKESDQNLVIENQMVELGFTQQVHVMSRHSYPSVACRTLKTIFPGSIQKTFIAIQTITNGKKKMQKSKATKEVHVCTCFIVNPGKVKIITAEILQV